jgi:hypothetical protein
MVLRRLRVTGGLPTTSSLILAVLPGSSTLATMLLTPILDLLRRRNSPDAIPESE